MNKHFHANFLCPWTTFHAGLNFPWKFSCFPWTTLSMSMDNNILFHGQCPWNLDFHGKTSLFHGIPCYVHGNPCIFHGKLHGSMEDLQRGRQWHWEALKDLTTATESMWKVWYISSSNIYSANNLETSGEDSILLQRVKEWGFFYSQNHKSVS